MYGGNRFLNSTKGEKCKELLCKYVQVNLIWKSSLFICVKITLLLYSDNTFHFQYFLNKSEAANKIYPVGKNHSTPDIFTERHSNTSTDCWINA